MSNCGWCSPQTMNPGKKQVALQAVNQFADAAVLALALYVSYALRRYQIIDFDVLPEIPPVEGFQWMFLVVVLFGPLLLEMQDL